MPLQDNITKYIVLNYNKIYIKFHNGGAKFIPPATLLLQDRDYHKRQTTRIKRNEDIAVEEESWAKPSPRYAHSATE